MSVSENAPTQEATLRTLLAQHTSLRGLRSGFGPLNLVRVSVTSKDVGEEAIEQELDALETAQKGWARRRSDFYRTPLSDIVRIDAGPLLQGEWALDDSKSVHIVHLGGGIWRKTEFVEGEGGPALAFDVDLEGARKQRGEENAEETATADPPEPVVRYRLYFNADSAAEGDIRPRYVRFCGYDERSS